MRIERKLTTAEGGAYAAIDFTTTTSEIRNPDGTVVFRLDAVDASARAARSGSPTYHHHSEEDDPMTAKKVYDVGALEPGAAQRIRVPEGSDHKTMIGRAKAAVSAWKRRETSAARAPPART